MNAYVCVCVCVHTHTHTHTHTHAHTHTHTYTQINKYAHTLTHQIELSTNTEDWKVIKDQIGLHPDEKCVLHTAYAADCSVFPPVVGALYCELHPDEKCVLHTYIQTYIHT